MPFPPGEYKYTFVHGKDALVAVDLATGDDMTVIGYVHDDIVVESSLTASMLKDLAKTYDSIAPSAPTKFVMVMHPSQVDPFQWKPKRRRGYKKQTTWDFLKK